MVGADQVPLPAAAELERFCDPERLSPQLSDFLDRAVTRSVSVLTGGPGTGKTTAIATLLRSMGMVARERGRPFRVAICAPTAKAAVRMREALDHAFGDKGMAEFAVELLIDPNSGSVHRLLEIRPDASVSRVELHCDLVIVDGGKGQLGMACRALQALGLHDQPISGLAKEFEEIYRPGESTPVRLDKDSGALRLLQRIRDEAHRVANGYNELLLRRRISESALDDIPGVSAAKKKTLLATFGSITRLRKATIETLAELPGISHTLAATILEHLNKGRS